MKKIAIINQRYGREVNGGSEYYTMQLAKHLRERYEVEILTSRALSYATWENHYAGGEGELDGVKVRRFPVRHKRRKLLLKTVGKMITLLHMNYRWLNRVWIKAQGPYVPDLIRYIEGHAGDYDVFIFVTYLYYPAVYGIGKVGDKAVFVPTAHDEPYIRFKLMEDVFTAPSAYVFLTEEERQLVYSLFPVDGIASEVAAMGIEPGKGGGTVDFGEKYGIRQPYLIYAGRIDVDKGCDRLIEYFERYCEENGEYVLALIGKSAMEIPQGGNIRYLGFVPEEDKDAGIRQARALCLPSAHESLSIAALEAMYFGTPVIANGESEVLKGHCARSGGGMDYTDYAGFREALLAIGDEGKYAAMSGRAVRYVRDNYQWKSVMEAWDRIIDRVTGNGGNGQTGGQAGGLDDGMKE